MEDWVPWRRRLPLVLFGALVMLLLILPSLIVIPMSFSAGDYLEFPPREWSLRWYDAYFDSSLWQAATMTSLIAGVATALLACVLGTAAAWGLRLLGRGASPLLMMLLPMPLTVPVILTAIGVFYLYARLDLVNSMLGLVLAHTMLAIPFVLILVLSRLQGFDLNQVRVAESLGARPVRAFFLVVLPQIRLSVAAGALFGVAILTRETLLYLLPVALIWLAWPKPRRWTLAALLAGSVFLIVAPWTVRNWIQFEAFIPVSTGGGLNLYQGNAGIQRGEVYDEYYANEGKVEQFQWARAAGLRAIWKRQPAWIFEKIRDEGPRLAELDSLALIHLRRGAYGPEVSCAAYRGVAFIVLVPWILIAMASVVALARAPMNRGTVLLLALLGAYLLLHIATHGFSRYRLPVLPAFMILAASLFGFDCATARSLGRRLLLVGLTVALALLWAPSLVDQMGPLGFAPPPAYEGFAPLCPAPPK